jgi:hypothetical protein
LVKAVMVVPAVAQPRVVIRLLRRVATVPRVATAAPQVAMAVPVVMVRRQGVEVPSQRVVTAVPVVQVAVAVQAAVAVAAVPPVNLAVSPEMTARMMCYHRSCCGRRVPVGRSPTSRRVSWC